MKIISLIAIAAFFVGTARSELVLQGEGKEQLTSQDVAEVESIAAEIIPGRRVAAIRCFASQQPDHHLSLLHVYAEPHEQTARVWHGLQFKCLPEGDYHPPVMGPGANEETRRANLTVHKRGRWIAPHADPVTHYIIIVPSGTVLPAFPIGFLERYSPCDFGRTTRVEDALSVYDFLADGAARVGDSQTFPDVTSQPLRFLQATGLSATVQAGRFQLTLARTDSEWRVTKIKQ